MKTSPGDAKVKFSNLQKSSVLISFAGVPATQLTQLEPFLKGFVFGTKILDWRPVKFGKIMTRRSRSMSPAGKTGAPQRPAFSSQEGGVSSMQRTQQQPRRRIERGKSFKERLADEAVQFRAEAAKLSPGTARELLLRRARQAETAAHIDDWLNELKSPD